MTQTMTPIIFRQEEARAVKLHISELIPLGKTDIPGAELAQRPIHESYVQGLMQSDSSTWPAIIVAAANIGFILVDGYQRQEAAIRNNVAILDAVVKPYADANEMIDEAFRSDLTHGLKASEQRKGDYAFWLACTFPTMTQEQIAKCTMMTQAGVSKAIAQREAALREAGLEEDVRQQLATERTFKQFSRRLVRFIGEVGKVSDEDLLKSLQASIKKEEDWSKLARVGHLLVQASSGQ